MCVWWVCKATRFEDGCLDWKVVSCLGIAAVNEDILTLMTVINCKVNLVYCIVLH